jgi:hypothetical protein
MINRLKPLNLFMGEKTNIQLDRDASSRIKLIRPYFNPLDLSMGFNPKSLHRQSKID